MLRVFYLQKNLCIVYGHGSEIIPNLLAASDLFFVKQESQLGTGHAVAQVSVYLEDDSPTLILYGDVPLITSGTLERLISSAGDNKVAVLTMNLPDPTGYGRIIRKHGSITNIVEQRDATLEEKEIRECNTGIMVAPTIQLKKWLPKLNNSNAQGEYYLTDIIANSVNEGTSVVSSQPDLITEALGVNNRMQLAKLERVNQRSIAENLLEKGVTLSDPDRLDVRGNLECGIDVSIDVGCVFEGKVHVGDGATIGAYCVIKNTNIGRSTNIKPFCHIEGTTIASGSQVGPYARLRPGTDLGKDVHIGNFVEIKNSQIAENSKANHLAYIGDTTVGLRVNIGAGTVTCNYNGAEKSRTIIGDDASIGSNSQLVAPVEIGRGATLGAGTTLTKNAPEEKLTISRVCQKTLDNWKRPVKLKIK
jgi:bifunctional UDP-N-acetylglucosamine pyrophosphorylase/glucosamine-1-phosphate N-acetyltransferase